jgi:hypothetical protein
MMKVSAFYYLQYPDDAPSNPRDASTEMYVEVGGEDASIQHFEKTFSFQVYTVEKLRRLVAEHGFATARSMIIVDELVDEAIRGVLERIVDKIEEFGTPVD